MKKHFWRIFLISFAVTTFAASLSQAASLVLDLNAFYFSDSLTKTATSTYGATAYAGFLGFAIDKKKTYQVGWNYASYSTTNKASSTTTQYTSSQMGPAFIFYFDKENNWRVSAAYNLVTTANYAVTGSTTEKWRGSGLSGDFGYQFHMSETFSFGVRINYSKTTINESLIGTTQSSVSYSKTLIYPSVALTAEF